jgi:predicted phage terminase large subunit-like protein
MTFKDAEDTDFVSGQVWGRVAADYYMLPHHVFERLDFGPSKDAVKTTHAKYPNTDAVLIEDKANGPAIISEIRRYISGVIAIEPEGGKLARGQAMSPTWEAGNVWLPDPEYFDVPWLADYIQIVCTFPRCSYDDPFDATSQAIIWMKNHAPAFGVTEYLKAEAERMAGGGSVKPPEPEVSPSVPDQLYTDLLIDADVNPEALDGTIKQLANANAKMLGGPGHWEMKDGHYVMRVFGDVGFVKFACEQQGYCKIVGHVGMPQSGPCCPVCKSTGISTGKQFGIVIMTCNACGASFDDV